MDSLFFSVLFRFKNPTPWCAPCSPDSLLLPSEIEWTLWQQRLTCGIPY